MGRAYHARRKTREARDVFTKLVMQMPDASRPDDFALEAVRQLDAFDNNSPNLTCEADHLLRASVYQFNRDFAGARVHYQARHRSFSAKHYRSQRDVPDRAWSLQRSEVRRALEALSESL